MNQTVLVMDDSGDLALMQVENYDPGFDIVLEDAHLDCRKSGADWNEYVLSRLEKCGYRVTLVPYTPIVL